MRAIAILLVVVVGACGPVQKTAELVSIGQDRELRHRQPGARLSAPETPPILLLGLDGVGRDQLYALLRTGKLPSFAMLLGGEGLAHAHFDDTLLAGMPSTTMPAWVTALTGVGAAEHGVPGNEYFIRETQTLACPAPVTFEDSTPTLEIFTDDYLNKLTDAPTVYEKIHARDPDALIWVAMHHLYRGADKLLLAKRTVIANAVEGFIAVQVKKHVEGKDSRKLYESLDRAVIDVIIGHLDKGPLPDVLTVYLSGTDLYAHIAEEGPDKARATYLIEVVDPLLGRLVAKLKARNALANRWVVVTADHGHTQVMHDDQHAIGKAGPQELLAKTGFRVRPFKRDAGKTSAFSAVIAYGGSTAYLYLADRSQCPGEQDLCAWTNPPRYEEDVLAAADALYRNNLDGSIVPAMKGQIDLIFTRRPKPVTEIDLPFEVYVGGKKTMPIAEFLVAHPHPTYIAMAARLHDLAVGIHGERAGDILLLAHNGDRETPDQRFYFASLYNSWHGSPSKQDSEIPLIVANPAERGQAIGVWVKQVLGEQPYQQRIADILLGLRARKPTAGVAAVK